MRTEIIWCLLVWSRSVYLLSENIVKYCLQIAFSHNAKYIKKIEMQNVGLASKTGNPYIFCHVDLSATILKCVHEQSYLRNLPLCPLSVDGNQIYRPFFRGRASSFLCCRGTISVRIIRSPLRQFASILYDILSLASVVCILTVRGRKESRFSPLPLRVDPGRPRFYNALTYSLHTIVSIINERGSGWPFKRTPLYWAFPANRLFLFDNFVWWDFFTGVATWRHKFKIIFLPEWILFTKWDVAVNAALCVTVKLIYGVIGRPPLFRKTYKID